MASPRTPIAIVGVGAILPGAPDAQRFWDNIQKGVYSITDVPPDRWDPRLYYDADPRVPDHTYSKIGGFVREFAWDPPAWRLPVPPRVAEAMDRAQKWTIATVREALADYGWPDRPLDRERTAVIFGNAMGGDRHYLTALRIFTPELLDELAASPGFAALPAATRTAILDEARAGMGRRLPPITEDTMPGELANVVAGRVAQLFDLKGPNFVCDAACASAMAAIGAAVEGLDAGEYDSALTGGIDANMSASTYVKFSKIGALSATGTRPYGEGADGFVMGEGAAVFLLKRLADAERAGDRVHAVIRGVAGASDGRGKGITAPNPVGQRLAIERAWKAAGLSPASATMMEGHGTSTPVGDLVEVQSMTEVLAAHGLGRGAQVALGSVKSNIGHLKAAAGAAGILKATLALRDRVLPPSLGCEKPNPAIDFGPLVVNTRLRAWEASGPRRAGVSAFGFGGTNFHVVLEEHEKPRTLVAVPGNGKTAAPPRARATLLAGGRTAAEAAARLATLAPGAPRARDLRAAARIAVDHGDAAELAAKRDKVARAVADGNPAAWKALRAQGVFTGAGAPGKVAFLFTGQGSQYVNMLRELRAQEPVVRDTFAEADEVMTPLLGRPLTEIIYVDDASVAEAGEQLKQTAVTQPAVLAADIALFRLLGAHGVAPDMVMGHSLGEYGALVAAGVLSFADALRAVSARGAEMTRVSLADNGAMVAVFGPLAEIERIVAAVDGYVVVANVNSHGQAVIGGATPAVQRATAAFEQAGYRVARLPVSHAFHTQIVAPASEPLRRTLRTLAIAPPRLPVVSNVTGGFYPGTVPEIVELLGRQVAEPVQFVKGLETLYAAGARVFVEVGPKKALAGLAEDVLGQRADVNVLATNHPKLPDAVALGQALGALYAAGLGRAVGDEVPEEKVMRIEQRIEGVVVTGAGLGLPGGARIFDDGNVKRILRGETMIDVIPVRLRRAMTDKHVTRLVKTDAGGGPRFEVITSPSEVIKLAGRGGALDLGEEFGVPAERIPALDLATRLAIAAGLEALRDAGIPLVMRMKTTTRGTKLPDRWVLPAEIGDETGVIFASAFPGLDGFAADLKGFHEDRAWRERLADLRAVRGQLDGRTAPEALAEIDRRIADIEELAAAAPYALDRRFLFRILSMGHAQFAELVGARGPNTQVNSACASGSVALATAEDWIRAGRCRRVVIVSADDATSDNMLEWVGAGFLASGAAATDEVVEEAAVPFDRRRHGLILGMGATAMVVERADAARERGLTPIVEILGTVAANSAFHGSRLDVEHISAVMEQLVAGVEQRHGLSRRSMAPELMFMSHETYTPARGGSAAAEVVALRRVFGDDADRVVIANTKGYTGHAMATAIEEVVAIKALETGIVPPVANFKEVDPELGRLNLSRGGKYPVKYALRLGAGFGSQIAMAILRWMPPPDGLHHAPAELGHTYRVADRARFEGWLQRVTGVAAPELEVVRRTLRVKDGGARGAVVPEVIAPVIVAVETPKAPAAVVPAVAVDEVRERVVAIVSKQTGYPPDMLDVDLDLEADLGVDTVKQAETFAAVREAYGIAREESLKLKDFPTIASVVRWVREKTVAAAPVPAPTPVVAVDEVRERVVAIVSRQTGYPPDMLDVDLDLEADLGVDTVKQAETFAAVREAYGIAREESLKLKDFPTIASVVRWVREKTVAAAPVPAPTPVVAVDEVRERVVAIVSRQTGYPPDMLDVDLDLEADLGVDTVKQAETFAAVREAYGIAREESLKLRDFPTIASVVRWVREKTVAAAPVPAPTPVVAVDEVRERVVAIVSRQTGYPPDMLEVDLDLEADLGVDTVKQAETFAAVREAYGIAREESLKLKDFPTIASVVRWVREKTGATVTTTPAPVPRPTPTPAQDVAVLRLRTPVPVVRPPLELCKPTGVALAAGDRVLVAADRGGVGDALVRALAARGVNAALVEPGGAARALEDPAVRGLYWLPALDDEGDPTALAPEAWRDAVGARIKALHGAAQGLYARLVAGGFAVAATRLGGLHGAGTDGATAPLGGAVTGFVKTLARERPEALVKAVDFDGADADTIAAALVAETLRDRGAVEIGRKDGLRFTLTLADAPLALDPVVRLGRDTVYVVTGAAGSIVSAIVSDLCAAGGTFYLLDLAPEADPADPDLARFRAGELDGLKRDLAHRLRERGERATPVAVERLLAALERGAAAVAASAAIARAGGTSAYRRVDLRDGAAVTAIVDEIRARHGRIDVLVHAAGLEISRFLPDKRREEFDLVFDVKADGWYHLLHAIADLPLGATVAFGSVAGRFGNGGQTDYAAANDLLCKLAAHARRARPATRALVIDWSAWAGIGMASRGSIPRMMAAAGIDPLPPEIAVPVVGRALRAGVRGELLAAGALGALEHEADLTGGLDPEQVAPRLAMVGRAVGMSLARGLTVETTLDPARQAFLFDHQIDGRPVLPAVMGIEAFVEIATLLVPGWRVQAVEDIAFLAPFKFYRGAPRAFTVEAQLEPHGDELWASCRLRGERTLPGQDAPQSTIHFTAIVRLARGVPAAQDGELPVTTRTPVGSDAVYRIYFHGPAYRVLADAARDGAALLGRLASPLPPDHEGGELVTPARLVELCFQTAGIWEIGTTGRLGLPEHVDRVVVLGRPAPGAEVFAVVTPRGAGGFDARIMDEAGHVFVTVDGYRTTPLGDVDPALRAPLAAAVS